MAAEAPGQVPVEVQIDTIRVELAAFRQSYQVFNAGILEDKRLAVADARNSELDIKALQELAKQLSIDHSELRNEIREYHIEAGAAIFYFGDCMHAPTLAWGRLLYWGRSFDLAAHNGGGDHHRGFPSQERGRGDGEGGCGRLVRRPGP